jgi:hypothetical protein
MGPGAVARPEDACPERWPTDGYQAFLLALRAEVIAFRRPVAYARRPALLPRRQAVSRHPGLRRLENFTRVETFGDNQANGNNDVNWLKVVVCARSREVFAYEPQIVPGNRTAVQNPTDGDARENQSNAAEVKPV